MMTITGTSRSEKTGCVNDRLSALRTTAEQLDGLCERPLNCGQPLSGSSGSENDR